MTNARHPRSASAIGLVLLNLVWQLYRCYGAGFDIDTENPINLVVRSVIFLLLIWYCDDIVNLALQIGGTPYNWILDSSLPGVVRRVLLFWWTIPHPNRTHFCSYIRQKIHLHPRSLCL